MKKIFIIWVAIVLIGIIGEIKCIVKVCNCNWNPIGKAEIIYTVAACTGVGAVVGWIDIKDE